MSSVQYSESLMQAAMAASFALIGVKDQRFMNVMVAHSLLGNRDRYYRDRPEIKKLTKAEYVYALDEWHRVDRN